MLPERRRTPRIAAALGAFMWQGQIFRIDEVNATGFRCHGEFAGEAGSEALAQSLLWPRMKMPLRLLWSHAGKSAFALKPEPTSWLYWQKNLYAPLRAAASLTLLSQKTLAQEGFPGIANLHETREMWYHGDSVALRLELAHAELRSIEVFKNELRFSFTNDLGWNVRTDKTERARPMSRGQRGPNDSLDCRELAHDERQWLKTLMCGVEKFHPELFEAVSLTNLFSGSLI